ncbi:MAG: glycosyltransferase family 9 protein [Candidatus Omnitrophica bacterium]|nr:glycosyltransferase family 9 protein [Candidatus Omnitrophota bacterium]
MGILDENQRILAGFGEIVEVEPLLVDAAAKGGTLVDAMGVNVVSGARQVQRRVLIVGVDWLGDVLFSTPLIRALKKRDPGMFLAYSTASRCLGVLKNNPYLDACIAYDELPFVWGMAGHLRWRSQLSRLSLSHAIFLHRSATRTFWVAAAGIRKRTGVFSKKQGWLLTERFPGPSTCCHRTDAYLSVLKYLGIPEAGREPDYVVTDEDRRAWDALRQELGCADGGYVVLHPGGNWMPKRWPAENFARLAAYLASSGMNVILCGTASEEALCRQIAMSSNPAKVKVAAGLTALGTLGALILGARLIVSNDSGPIHLAAALGTPIVGLYGPTSPAITGAVSRGPSIILHHGRVESGCHVPCYRDNCRDISCMKMIRVEEVVRASEQLLGRRNG